MKTELELPDDIDALRRLAADFTRELRQLQTANAALLNQNAILQEQINLLLHKRFGANSEKYRAEQSDLFNEAEAYAEEGGGEAEIADAESSAQEAPVEAAITPEQPAPRKPGRTAPRRDHPRPARRPTPLQ